MYEYLTFKDFDMNKEEKEMFSELIGSIQQLREENRTFRETIETRITSVEKQHAPVNMELAILGSIQENISAAIEKSLTGYNSPLSKLTDQVVSSHSAELRKIIDDALSQVLSSDYVRLAVLDGFNHKIARILVSNVEGLVDRSANKLKQDPQFMAKATLAIADLVNQQYN